MVNVLTFQHKGLLQHLKQNEIYECKQTRESKHKYWRIQKELQLPEDTYPVWVFKPDTSEYIGLGQICTNENKFLKEEVQTKLFGRFLFHISMSWIDRTKLRELISNCYLYELQVDEQLLYDDTLEGYTLCKVMKNIKSTQLVEVYEMTELDSQTEMLRNLSYFEDYDEEEMQGANRHGIFLLNLRPILKTNSDTLSESEFTVGVGDFIVTKEDLPLINKHNQ